VWNVVHCSSFSTARFASSGVTVFMSTGHLSIFSSMSRMGQRVIPCAFASSIKARISGEERVLPLCLGADLLGAELGVNITIIVVDIELVGFDHRLLVVVHHRRG